MRKKIISGVQASGCLHIGNYLGAINHWIKLQDSNECIFFIADLHAITVEQSPQDLKSNIYNSLATYLACGIDPQKSTIFAQSHVSAHCELSWILTCMTPMGWLKRMTQFKSKSSKDKELSGAGLLIYPDLMAADILLYDADLVPVGADQKQHLELTRDLAELFNKRFNQNIFALPEPMILGNSTRIMSLRDGKVKMSKSDPSDQARINLHDDSDSIALKVQKAKTDSLNHISYDPLNRPEISNLINIYSDISNKPIEWIVSHYEGGGFMKFKKDLFEILVEFISPIRTKIKDYMNNKDHLSNIFKEGSQKAEAKAKIKLDLVKETLGFIL